MSLRTVDLSATGAAALYLFKRLFECATQQLLLHPQNYLFHILTDEGWLQACLREAGFKQFDAIRTYKRTSRAVQPARQQANLRLARKSDLPGLVVLDAAAFAPLWHMSAVELFSLQRDHRFEVAESGVEIVGYTALRLIADDLSDRFGSAHLVRLAVHPLAQDRGIGRQLLVSSLNYAHNLGAYDIFLNTQESNSLARKLYESLQFRKSGRSIPVLVKRIPA